MPQTWTEEQILEVLRQDDSLIIAKSTGEAIGIAMRKLKQMQANVDNQTVIKLVNKERNSATK